MINFKPIARKVLGQCLCLKPHEQLLVIGDYGINSRTLAESFSESAREICAASRYIINKGQSEFDHADKGLIYELKNLPEKSVVILAVSNKLGELGALGKSFRSFCKKKKHRFISTTGLSSLNKKTFSNLVEAIDVGYEEMHKEGLQLKKQIDKAREIRIKTDLGTDIRFDVSGIESACNAGDYRINGMGGNIPAGEVYTAPRGTRNVDGIVVVDGSIRTDIRGMLVKEPVKITVKNGKAVRIEGGREARLLNEAVKRAEAKARYPERIRIIGEVGIGINPMAKIVGTTIIDEKAAGTAHIALGSNYWFGGANRTVFHADQVFKDPHIYLDGEEISIKRN